MSQSLPCLNPTCAHTFSAEEVKASPALQCPECGSVFHLRSAPAATPRQAAKPAPVRERTKPQARPVPLAKPPAVEGPPLAKPPAAQEPPLAKPPAAQAPPLAKPPAAQEPSLARPPAEQAPPLAKPPAVQGPPLANLPAAQAAPMEGGIVSGQFRERAKKKPWTRQQIAMTVAAFAVGISLLLLFLVILNSMPAEDFGPAGRDFIGRFYNTYKRQEDIFRLTLPDGVWTHEGGTRAGLNNAVVAMTGEQPDVWFAVAAKDYETRLPRRAELLKECVARLEAHFGGSLELAEKAENTEFAGQDAQSLEFRGQIKQVIWHGECYTFAHHGVGYFFFIAGVSLDLAREELAKFDGSTARFDIINKRHGWAPQPPKYVTTRGRNAPLYFRTLEGVWEVQRAGDEDERGEILMLGRYSKDEEDPNANRKNASILVLAFDKSDDLNQAVASAVEYIQSRKKLEDVDYKVAPLEEVKQAEFGKPADVGNRRGRIVELEVKLGPEPKRYILLAIVANNTNTFAIRCDCTWEARQIWREEFLDLLQQFNLKS